MEIVRIVSGGQTGVDRAALDAGLDAGVPCGGWCPRGRRAEDGAIPDRYGLTETASRAYRVRTRLNVRDSDGTLVLAMGPVDGGTGYTVRCAEALGRPLLVIDLAACADPDRAAATIAAWAAENRIAVLNVAGPRESSRPGVGAAARRVLDRLCAVIRRRA
jgi:hypothetical protein